MFQHSVSRQSPFLSYGNGMEMEFINGICLPMEHLKSAQELVQHVSVHSDSNWNLAVLVFEERGKPEYPEKNLSEQGENQQHMKLNPHMTPGPGIEPGPHWWEASALTTVPPLVVSAYVASYTTSLFSRSLLLERTGQPQHRGLYPLLFSNSVWVL